jgi:hypothetical protein
MARNTNADTVWKFEETAGVKPRTDEELKEDFNMEF